MIIKHRVSTWVRRSAPSKHFICYGGTGSGKDVYCLGYLQRKKGKVWDVLGFERGEGMTNSLPMDYEKFILLGKRLTNGVYKPRGTKHEVIIIYGKKFDESFEDGTKKYKKIPKNIKICTFRCSDLDRNDWISLLSQTKSSQILVQKMIDYLYDEKGMKTLNIDIIIDLIDKIINKTHPEFKEKFYSTHAMTMGVVKSNLIIIKNSGIFDERFEHIDLEESYQNQDTMTTVSCYFADSDIEKAVTAGLILKKIYDMQTSKKYIEDNYIFLRELHIPYKKVLKEEADIYTLLKNYVYKVLTEGRQSKIWIVANTQNTLQIPDYIRQHFRKVFSFSQNRKGIEALQEYGYIDPVTLKKLLKAKKFIGINIIDGEYDYPCYTLPPTFKTKAAGEGVWDLLLTKFGGIDRSNYNIDTINNNNKTINNNISKNNNLESSPTSLSNSEKPPYSAL